jgi:hypothetical protein
LGQLLYIHPPPPYAASAAVNLEQLDLSNEQLAKALERQRLGNVLAVCQCLLLIAVIAVLAVLLLKH